MKWLGIIFLSVMCHVTYADESLQPVTPEHITKWKGDSYCGSIKVRFASELGIIRAHLETDDLMLVSLSSEHLEYYMGLFTNPSAVNKYACGQPWTEDEVNEAVQQWIARWEQELDPFSAFAIFRKNKDRTFIGHIVLGHGSRYGQSELAFLFSPAYHDLGYATQAVSAILYGYVPRLLQDRYPVNLNNSAVEPSPLRSIHATGHFDDTFSGQAMIRSGMKIGEEDILWGAQRFHYLIRADEILNKIQPLDNSLYGTGD